MNELILAKKKKIATQQKLKDAQKHGEIDVMDYLIKISEFIADYD